MGLTSDIESFLLNMLEVREDKMIEIGRNDLANQFNCAPSQINYVLATRFTPYNGYYVESKRGGSGYIKIYKLELTEEEIINEILQNTIEDQITLGKAKHVIEALIKEGVITRKEGLIMNHAIGDRALQDIDSQGRNQVRASIFKSMLLSLLRD